MNLLPVFAVEYSPFYGIEKGLVLQETRVFNEAHVDPRRCQQVITKLLYLLTQGESFTKVRILCWITFDGFRIAVAVVRTYRRRAVASGWSTITLEHMCSLPSLCRSSCNFRRSRPKCSSA